MHVSNYTTKHLVLVGGGHSHIHVLRRLIERPLSGLRVTLISRDVMTAYSGMLPGYIAGHYQWQDMHIDLAPLCAAGGIRLIDAAVTNLDLKNRTVTCAGRPPFRFDLLSINVGSAPATGEIHGASQSGVVVKPISRFLPRWHALLERLKNSPDRNLLIVMVGGGAGGVELALAIEHRLRKVEGLNNFHFKLISADPLLVSGHDDATRRWLTRELGRRNFDVHLGARVLGVRNGVIETDVDGNLPADEIIWATHSAPQEWLQASGLVVDEAGFVRVNAHLQSLSDAEIFAAGDIATVEGEPRPKAGVFAVRQGAILAKNLYRAACGLSLETYTPQTEYLSLISAGRRRAAASRGGMSAHGRWVWQWKDRIDRRFVESFRVANLQSPKAKHCAVLESRDTSSVRGDVLFDSVLRAQKTFRSAEIIAGVEEDAAVLRPIANGVEVQAIADVSAITNDPYSLGRISTEHALNDVYAMGGKPRTALAAVTVTDAHHKLVLDDVRQVLAGISDALLDKGATLVDGRLRVGPEPAVAITASGTVDEHDVMLKRRISIGDLLILTKPLGGATILAADKDGGRRGDWWQSAVAEMMISNHEAISVLKTFGSRACTHVAQQGLIGHAIAMAAAARLSIQLWPAAIPVLDGVHYLSQRSAGDNSDLPADIAQAIEYETIPEGDAVVRVLSNPEISGALLAAVRPDRADNCLKALQSRAYVQASIVGRVCAPDGDKFCSLVVR